MYKSGTARREADAQLARELGVRARRHPSELFVRNLDELDRAASAAERAEHAVDAVPGKAVDAANAPRDQSRDDRIAHRTRRCGLLTALLASISLHSCLVSTDVFDRASVVEHDPFRRSADRRSVDASRAI